MSGLSPARCQPVSSSPALTTPSDTCDSDKIPLFSVPVLSGVTLYPGQAPKSVQPPLSTRVANTWASASRQPRPAPCVRMSMLPRMWGGGFRNVPSLGPLLSKTETRMHG